MVCNTWHGGWNSLSSTTENFLSEMKKQFKVAQRKTYFIVDCTGTKWIIKPKSGKKIMSQLKNSNTLWLQVWILLSFFGIFIWGFSWQRRIRLEYIGFCQYIIISCHFEWTWYVKIILLPKYWCRTNHFGFQVAQEQEWPCIRLSHTGLSESAHRSLWSLNILPSLLGKVCTNPQALRTVSVAKDLIWALLMYTTLP